MTVRALPLLVALAVLAGCGGGSDDEAATSAPTVAEAPSERSGFPATWSAPELVWEPCALAAGDGECSTLEVPLDWDEPDGPTIELALARVRSGVGGDAPALLTNPGGPGASGVDYLGGFATATSLGDRFDLVSWDPRGVGRSTAIDCDGNVESLYSADPSPDDDTERSALEGAAATVAADCAAAAPELLEHVHTEEVARDLEAIRLALGNQELNYLGFSYGTHIGQVYAELFGDRIRAMVLDGVVDPSLGFEEFLLGQTAAFEEAFATQAAGCTAAGRAQCGVEDLEASFDDLLAQAEESPLRGGRFGEVGPAEVVLAATYTGYLPSGWTLLGPALADADAGDAAALAELADSYISLGSYGPYAGVVCTDSPPPGDVEEYRDFAARAAEVSPRFGPSVANEMLPCATWGAPAQADAAALSAPGAPPILVIGNTGDPATPLANAEAVADSLESGVLVVVEMDGHTAYGSDACATAIVDDYFRSLELPQEGVRC